MHFGKRALLNDKITNQLECVWMEFNVFLRVLSEFIYRKIKESIVCQLTTHRSTRSFLYCDCLVPDCQLYNSCFTNAIGNLEVFSHQNDVRSLKEIKNIFRAESARVKSRITITISTLREEKHPIDRFSSNYKLFTTFRRINDFYL